jgi:mannose-6-phosphate isomerase-like protein (cupin superfamily)
MTQIRAIAGWVFLAALVGVATPTRWEARIGAPGVVRAQGTPRGTAESVPPAPTDEAMYIANSESQSIWKDLEARNAIVRRVMDGGTYSINVRVGRPGDPPWIHTHMTCLWIVQAGSATAVSGGQLLDAKTSPQNDDLVGSSVTGGIERSLGPGDILYVPPGVAHQFTNQKGFRALVIHFNTR